MTNPPNDTKKKFKEEIETTIFESMDFTSDMKNKIRENIQPVQKKSWFLKHRSMTMMSAAAILFLSIISMVYLQNSEEPNNDNVSILMGNDNQSNLLDGPTAIQSWELKTATEASQLFGSDLRFPTYIPKDFTLERIHATGMKKEEPTKLVLTYQSGDLSYIVMADKFTMESKPLNYDVVDINGTTGYLKKEETISELIWNKGDFHYVIAGLISSEEAMKIARSFK